MTNGILKYTEAKVSIFFEPEHVCCRYCPMLGETPRYQCRRTGSYIVDLNTVDRWCPLEFTEEEQK